jgi:inner membrane protein
VYRPGHYGVSLLVFAPAGFLLVRAGAPLLAVLTGAVAVWLAMLPDVDHRIPGVPHRGPTHSLAFAALVGGAFAAVASALPWVALTGPLPLPPVAFGFALGAGSVLAHLLADTLTPAGVDYLWPLPSNTSLGLCRADDTLANYGLLAVGALAAAAGLYAGGI